MAKSLQNSGLICLFLCLLFWLFSPSSTLFAQEGEGQDPVIVDLDVRGDAVLSRDEVLKLFPGALGEKLSRSSVRKLLKALYDTGKVRDAAVYLQDGGAGVVLVVELTARLFVSSVSFAGADMFDAKRLAQAFGIRAGDEFWVEKIASAQKLLKQALYDAGYRKASVKVFESKAPEGVALYVDIQPGEPTRITSLRLRGAELFLIEESTLRLKAGSILDRALVKEDAAALRALARGLGYYEAKISEPLEEEGEDGVSLVYDVDLGPRYEVDITGLRALSREEALKALSLEEEGTIATSTLSAAASRLTEALENLGYAKARVSAKISVRQEKYRLLRFDVSEGPLVAIAAISFPGAERFSEKELRQIVWTRLEDGLYLPQEKTALALDDMGVTSGRKSPYEEEEPDPSPTRPLRPKEIYRPKALRQALSDISARYRALGYESIVVGPPVLSEDEEARLFIEIPIQEGPQTKVESVHFEGIAALSSKELLSGSPLGDPAIGAPYTQERLESTVRAFLEKYARKGYLYAQVNASAEARETPEGPRMRVLFEVKEGPQVTTAGFLFEGNVTTKEAAIRRYIPLRKGDVLTYEALRLAQRRLLSLGIFESVSIELEDKDIPAAEKRVLVTVRERKAGAFEYSVGLSSNDGPRGRFLLSHGNLWGETIAVSLRVQVNDSQLNFFGTLFSEIFQPGGEPVGLSALAGTLERKAALSLRPPLLGKALGSLVFGEMSLVHQRLNRKAFNITQNAVGLSLGNVAEPKRGLSFLFQADIEADNAESTNGQDLESIRNSLPLAEQDILKVFEGRTVLVSARPQLFLDLRDNRFNPSQGLFAQLALDFAKSFDPPGKDLNFVSLVRLLGTTAAYVPYQRVVFELIGRGGVVIPLSPESQTPPDRLFFLGGNGSIRGFPEEGLLPQDFAQNVSDALAIREEESRGHSQGEFLTPVTIPRSLGGNSFLAFSLGMRFPLQFLPIPAAEGEVFLDLGNSWLEPLSFDPFLLRGSLGTGLRIPTPIGPIRAEVAFKLDRRVELEEGAGQFHFTLGAF